MTEKLKFGANVLVAVGISYLGQIGAFFSGVLIARLLGVEGKGAFSLFTETVFGLVVFSGLGVGDGQTYCVSKDGAKIRHFMPNAYLLSAVLGGGVAVIYYLGGMAVHLKMTMLLGWTAVVLGVIVSPVMLLQVFQRQFFLSRHDYKIAKVNGALAMVLPFGAYLIVYASGHLSVESCMIAFVASQILTLCLFQVVVIRFAPAHGSVSLPFAKESFSFGIQYYLSGLMQYLTFRLDFFVVAAFLGKRGLGIYSVSVALSEITSRLTREVGTILFPAFASDALLAGRAVPMLRKLFFVGLVVSCFLIIISYPLTVLVFGEQFQEAVNPLRILLFGTLALNTTFVTLSYVSAAGRPFVGAPIFGAAAVMDLLLNILLLPHLGVMGASIAATISYCFAAYILLAILCRNEGCSAREVFRIRRSDIAEIFEAIRGALSFVLRRS